MIIHTIQAKAISRINTVFFIMFAPSNYLLIYLISCYTYLMTIEQTIEIPADHRIFLDLPLELPVGKAKVTVTPQMEKPVANGYEAAANLRGLAKKMGSTLTVERFLEMRQEDLLLEEAKYRRFFGEKG